MLMYTQKEKEKIDSLSPYNAAGILQILHLITTNILIPIVEMREIRLKDFPMIIQAVDSHWVSY